MPCWTVTQTETDIDAQGVDRDRLTVAAEECGFQITFIGNKARLTDRRSRYGKQEMATMVKRLYAEKTVVTGMQKFGFRVQKRESTFGNVKLTVGR